ncbi:MAG: hypothetical protein HRT44_09270, partial [Bdellovibrionales bacterium]|nr:hypothetical protein [Bdellovibrionales bacterium]NQZ19429.1 hypothetical protein [Bdellovibrionales bacterium]
DVQGTRLGRGGGYYDRFLAQYGGIKIGVVFNEGLTTDLLPREDHDQLMDIVATPSQWVEVNLKEEVQNGI